MKESSRIKNETKWSRGVKKQKKLGEAATAGQSGHSVEEEEVECGSSLLVFTADLDLNVHTIKARGECQESG